MCVLGCFQRPLMDIVGVETKLVHLDTKSIYSMYALN